MRRGNPRLKDNIAWKKAAAERRENVTVIPGGSFRRRVEKGSNSSGGNGRGADTAILEETRRALLNAVQVVSPITEPQQAAELMRVDGQSGNYQVVDTCVHCQGEILGYEQREQLVSLSDPSEAVRSYCRHCQYRARMALEAAPRVAPEELTYRHVATFEKAVSDIAPVLPGALPGISGNPFSHVPLKPDDWTMYLDDETAAEAGGG
jgi:hypothetical protein